MGIFSEPPTVIDSIDDDLTNDDEGAVVSVVDVIEYTVVGFTALELGWTTVYGLVLIFGGWIMVAILGLSF